MFYCFSVLCTKSRKNCKLSLQFSINYKNCKRSFQSFYRNSAHVRTVCSIKTMIILISSTRQSSVRNHSYRPLPVAHHLLEYFGEFTLPDAAARYAASRGSAQTRAEWAATVGRRASQASSPGTVYCSSMSHAHAKATSAYVICTSGEC